MSKISASPTKTGMTDTLTKEPSVAQTVYFVEQNLNSLLRSLPRPAGPLWPRRGASYMAGFRKCQREFQRKFTKNSFFGDGANRGTWSPSQKACRMLDFLHFLPLKRERSRGRDKAIFIQNLGARAPSARHSGGTELSDRSGVGPAWLLERSPIDSLHHNTAGCLRARRGGYRIG